MYSINYRLSFSLFLVILIVACSKEEENRFCNDSILESKAEHVAFCENHNFGEDTIILSSLLVEKDSLNDRVSDLELGLQLAGTFYFNHPECRLVLYAKLSEDFDSLLIIENIVGTFTEHLDWVGHTNFCTPKKRGHLDLSLNTDSTLFAPIMNYNMNCQHRNIIFDFEKDGFQYKIWGDFYNQ